jgi:signal transduction histidine kinase
MAQREPADWDLRADDDSHQGLGLWLLKKLVERTGGQLWILSGKAQYLLMGDSERTFSYPHHWPGVVIELEIPVNSVELVTDRDSEDLGHLAEELAI